jgi:hypothetical protein
MWNNTQYILECARHAIIGYLLLKGQQWRHQIVTALEKETTCLRKSDISQIAAKDLFRLIQLDVLHGWIEYFLLARSALMSFFNAKIL